MIYMECLSFFLFPPPSLIIYHPVHFFMLIPAIITYPVSATSTQILTPVTELLRQMMSISLNRGSALGLRTDFLKIAKPSGG